jgi:hypothetical protein
MRYLILSLALGCLLVIANFGRAQTVQSQSKGESSVRNEKSKAAQTTKAAEATLKEVRDARSLDELSLDNLLAQALKNNPDIRVADAKMREAEAELNRVKLQVSQKVVAQQREIAACKAALQYAQVNYERMQALYKKHAIEQAILSESEAKLQKANAELARVEAELPYILGAAARGALTIRLDENFQHLRGERALEHVLVGVQKPKAETARQTKSQREEVLRALDLEMANLQASEAAKLFQAHHTSLPEGMAGRLRKALDTTVKVDFTQVGPKEILAYLQDQTNGFNLVDQVNIKTLPSFDLRLMEPVRVGAVFQLLEDQFGLRFVVREYGIVITEANRVPPGAVSLQSFWKDRPSQPYPTPPAKEKK